MLLCATTALFLSDSHCYIPVPAGNHDFDHGLEEFTKRRDESSFPWLMANVLDNETGQPLGGALPSLVLEWHGVRVGLVGGWVGGWVRPVGRVGARAGKGLLVVCFKHCPLPTLCPRP